MSNPNDGDKGESGKSFPMDLASKVTVKTPEITKSSFVIGTQPLRTISQPQMRVLTPSINPITSSSNGQTVISTIVPQILAKPRQITIPSANFGHSYHVPRGPAAVANMAAPRATVATAIRGQTVSTQPIGAAVVRSVAPQRTPSPTVNIIGSVGAQWLPGATVQVQTTQNVTGVKNVSNSLLVSQQQTSQQRTAIVPIIPGRSQMITRSPALSSTARPTLLQSTITVGAQAGAQIHAFKPVVTVQSVATSVAITQVVQASRPQTLVYSSVTSGQHISTAPQLTLATNAVAQRQVQTNRTVQLSNPRSIPAVVATVPQLSNTTKVAVTQAQGTVLTAGTRIATTQDNTLSAACITVTTQPSNLSRFAVTTTVQSSVQNTNITRLGSTVLTSPTGKFTASVVSLHPVVVSNAPQAQINITQARALQGQGKMITQIPHGSIQIAQVASTGKQPLQQSISVSAIPVTVTPENRPVNNQTMRINQMVVEQARARLSNDAVILTNPNEQSIATLNQIPVSVRKQTSSPRPSILRKRDNEGSPLKAAKNLTSLLATLPTSPVSPPSRPDSRGTGQSSAGSTTISATSSPGPDESPSPTIINAASSLMLSRNDSYCEDARPTPEMSPRKKPRKQQLTGNDLLEPKLFDMHFPSDQRIKEEASAHTDNVPIPEPEVTVRKPAPVCLLNSYHQTWKSTHNHFLRYTDVKPKVDKQRPSIMEIVNQKRVLQKVDGWKIYHLSTQIEDLSDLETQVYEKLSNLLQTVEAKDRSKKDKDIDRINDLIKGNMQRSKIINEGMLDSKVQIMKIFDHKTNVRDIIIRCASKRNFKKREKS